MPKFKLNNLPFYRQYASVFVFNLILIILFIIIQNQLPPRIPLYYGLPKGAEQLAPRLAIIIPPLICLVISLFNQLISAFIESDFAKKVLIFVCFVTTLLSTMTVVKIIMLVGKFS